MKLAAEGDETPVLFVTAHDDPSVHVRRRWPDQCIGYLRKTDAGSELLNAIRRVVSLPATRAVTYIAVKSFSRQLCRLAAGTPWPGRAHVGIPEAGSRAWLLA
jgi:DNA-binding NarL/FixJ family response regulator